MAGVGGGGNSVGDTYFGGRVGGGTGFGGGSGVGGGDPRDEVIDYLKVKLSEDDARITKLETASNRAAQRYRNVVDASTKEFDAKLLKVQDQFNQDRMKVIEVIGIFVSIFTFVSAEIAIMKSVPVEYLSGFTLILLGGLSFFVLLMRYMVGNLINDTTTKEVNRALSWNDLWNGIRSIWMLLILLTVGFIFTGVWLTQSSEAKNTNGCDSVDSKSCNIQLLKGGDTYVRSTKE